MRKCILIATILAVFGPLSITPVYADSDSTCERAFEQTLIRHATTLNDQLYDLVEQGDEFTDKKTYVGRPELQAQMKLLLATAQGKLRTISRLDPPKSCKPLFKRYQKAFTKYRSAVEKYAAALKSAQKKDPQKMSNDYYFDIIGEFVSAAGQIYQGAEIVSEANSANSGG